jgi:hypothetical protein
MAGPVTESLSTRRRGIPWFEIDQPADFELVKWTDFLPSESGFTFLELVAAIATVSVFEMLVGRQLGVVVLIFVGHTLLLLLFTGLRTCNR